MGPWGYIRFNDKFHRTYVLENSRNILVVDKLNQECWNSYHRRLPRGGVEMTQWGESSELLGSVVLSSSPNRWRWSGSSLGEF